jgi:hypothetical protein
MTMMDALKESASESLMRDWSLYFTTLYGQLEGNTWNLAEAILELRANNLRQFVSQQLIQLSCRLFISSRQQHLRKAMQAIATIVAQGKQQPLSHLLEGNSRLCILHLTEIILQNPGGV